MQLLYSSADKAEPMDVDSFQKLLVAARSVGVVRPASLSAFVVKHSVESKEVPPTTDDGGNAEVGDQEGEMPEMGVKGFINKLLDCFWRLYGTRCTNQTVAPVCSGGCL